MRVGRLEEAFLGYTEMIGAHEDSKDSSVLYINRALCALQMRKYNDALEDAEAALNLILEGREGPGELASLAKDLHARAAKGTGMESLHCQSLYLVPVTS